MSYMKIKQTIIPATWITPAKIDQGRNHRAEYMYSEYFAARAPKDWLCVIVDKENEAARQQMRAWLKR